MKTLLLLQLFISLILMTYTTKQNQEQGNHQDQGQGYSQNQGQGYSQNQGQGNQQNQGQGYHQDQGQGNQQNQGQSNHQNQGHGNQQNQGQDYSQNQGQGNQQNQGQDYRQKQGQGNQQNQGQGNQQNQGQGNHQNQGQGNQQNQGQDYSQNQGQGNQQNQGQGNQQNQGQDYRQKQGQGNQQNQGQSNQKNQGQDYSQNQGQGNQQNQGQGNQQNQGQGNQQNQGQVNHKNQEQGNQQNQEQGNHQWQESVSQSQMDFAVRIYQQISSHSERPQPNLFISPISIYITLSMLALGAQGKTREEILDTLGLDGTKTDMGLHEGNKKILQELQQQSKDMAFKLGNEIFLRKGGAYLPQFRLYLADYYNTAIQTISFSDPEAAKRTINNIVSDRTDQKIQNMVSRLDWKTSMVLVDYAVFQGKWKSKFYRSSTEILDFMLSDGTSVPVPMMRQWGLFKTYKDNAMGSDVVELPYEGNVSLFIILPQSRTLSSVEIMLTAQKVKEYVQSVRTSFIRLRIPKLSFNHLVDLRHHMMVMGMESMFTENANFLRFSKDEKLQVSDIYHQSYIDIEEEETEMSSATDAKFNIVIPSLFFNVDRPFIMLIYHKVAETILGMGRVMNPSWSVPQQQGQGEIR
ncbi:serine protease inhibitor A3K-like [Aquarana catesbeiana]|uniref:serine protease inhibitor A3K-like n=1 Tax=Aquarana catesbeiana TaxID=8400 RepID=UPI003CC9BD60